MAIAALFNQEGRRLYSRELWHNRYLRRESKYACNVKIPKSRTQRSFDLRPYRWKIVALDTLRPSTRVSSSFGSWIKILENEAKPKDEQRFLKNEYLWQKLRKLLINYSDYWLTHGKRMRVAIHWLQIFNSWKERNATRSTGFLEFERFPSVRNSRLIKKRVFLWVAGIIQWAKSELSRNRMMKDTFGELEYSGWAQKERNVQGLCST